MGVGEGTVKGVMEVMEVKRCKGEGVMKGRNGVIRMH